MKPKKYSFMLLLLLLCMYSFAQRRFTKRKYTRGIFHEWRHKPKQAAPMDLWPLISSTEHLSGTITVVNVIQAPAKDTATEVEQVPGITIVEESAPVQEKEVAERRSKKQKKKISPSTKCTATFGKKQTTASGRPITKGFSAAFGSQISFKAQQKQARYKDPEGKRHPENAEKGRGLAVGTFLSGCLAAVLEGTVISLALADALLGAYVFLLACIPFFLITLALILIYISLGYRRWAPLVYIGAALIFLPILVMIALLPFL